MISPSGNFKLYLASIIMNEFELDPFSRAIFIFRSKRADRMKIIVWDGTSLVMTYKCIEGAGSDPGPRSRPKLEVADIIRTHGGYRRDRAGHLNLPQLKVMSEIETCRTAALGGHVAACTKCGHRHIAYNSCRNRHCPKCQGAASQDWVRVGCRRMAPAGSVAAQGSSCR